MSKSPPVVPSNVVPFPGKLSSGKRADIRSGCAFDVHQFYTRFGDHWMDLLHKHFDGPVDVASHFKTTERAAAKWWAGIGGPRGDKVALALMTLPGAADDLLALPGHVRRAA